MLHFDASCHILSIGGGGAPISFGRRRWASAFWRRAGAPKLYTSDFSDDSTCEVLRNNSDKNYICILSLCTLQFWNKSIMLIL